MFLPPEDRLLARPALWLPDRRVIAPTAMPHPGVSPQRAARKRVVAAPPPEISYVGEDEGNHTVSIGSTGREAGDLIVWAGIYYGFSNAPNLPSGFSEIHTRNTGSGGAAISITTGWKYSDGTETNITSAAGGSQALYSACVILRGVHESDPIGDDDYNDANSATMTFGPLTLAASSSWVVAFGCARNNISIPTPSSMTSRTGINNAIDSVCLSGWTLGPTATFTSRTSSITSGRWIASAIEILVAA